MVKSKDSDILNKLNNVDPKTLSQFKDAAISFLESNDGDPIMALQVAMSYASGI
jgi:hypothetical protein